MIVACGILQPFQFVDAITGTVINNRRLLNHRHYFEWITCVLRCCVDQDGGNIKVSDKMKSARHPFYVKRASLLKKILANI